MVTHIPPSPSLSSTSLSVASQSSSRRTARLPLPPPSVFPPSPPSSYSYGDAAIPYAPSDISASAQHRRISSGGRAPSVASTSAARRPSHRTNRRSRRGSDVDGTSEAPTNAFPWFSQSGDVEISITDSIGRAREKRYLLHSLILAQNSPWFADEFGEAARQPSERRGSQVSDRGIGNESSARGFWRYELRWDATEPRSETRIPLLVKVANIHVSSSTRSRSKPPTSNASFFSSLTSRHPGSRHTSLTHHLDTPDSVQWELDIIEAYDNLFLAFYNHSPNLDTANIATAYVQCKALVQVADLYAAQSIVGPRCDHHLLRYQSNLWKQIAKYPASYLRMGYMARSNAIFREAIIHVVGQWPASKKQLARGSSATFDRIIDLIEDKADELEEASAKVESKLFRISLTSSRGERVGPLNSWTDWLAISLFRQWLADQISPAHSSIMKDSVARRESSRKLASSSLTIGRTFQQIARGGEAYLSHDELKKFLKKTPTEYSREGLRRFERRMDELKNLARDIVKPMTRNFLELDAEVEGLPYLTCTRVEDGDLRWIWRT